jgi:branched-chain amino acid aminotransferase
MYSISIDKVPESNLPNVDLENLPFGRVFTDHMFTADYINGEWTNLNIGPVVDFCIHPGNLTLHYAQSIFEGMKASADDHGNPLLLRPEMHIERLNRSAERMCMPKVPEELFHQALQTLVNLEKDWIPSKEGSALYIRPFMFATDEFIGVAASETYKLVILTLPVGPYYSKPVNLKAETEFVRAAPGGVGDAKTAGNYAASIYPAKKAKSEGYDQVLWLDGKEFKYVQEVGTMNIFFVIGDKVLTPAFNGAILHGITRDSIIQILRDEGHTVEERDISIDEIIAAHEQGQLKEVFGTGTAAVVSNVKNIGYKGKDYPIDVSSFKIAPFAKDYISKLRRGQIEDTRGWVVKLEEPVVV